MSGNMFESLVPYRLLQSDHLGLAGSQFLASFRHVNQRVQSLSWIWPIQPCYRDGSGPKSTEDYREKLCPEDCNQLEFYWLGYDWPMLRPKFSKPEHTWWFSMDFPCNYATCRTVDEKGRCLVLHFVNNVRFPRHMVNHCQSESTMYRTCTFVKAWAPHRHTVGHIARDVGKGVEAS